MAKMTTLRRLARLGADLSPRAMGYIAIAVVDLAIARIDVARLPASAILAQLRNRQPPQAASASPVDLQAMAWALRVAPRLVPWRANCLVRSLAACRWLRRRGLMPDFRLDVRRQGDDTLVAHAWVECSGVALVDAAPAAQFHTLIAD